MFSNDIWLFSDNVPIAKIPSHHLICVVGMVTHFQAVDPGSIPGLISMVNVFDTLSTHCLGGDGWDVFTKLPSHHLICLVGKVTIFKAVDLGSISGLVSMIDVFDTLSTHCLGGDGWDIFIYSVLDIVSVTSH